MAAVRTFRAVIVALALLSPLYLSACGGGGGGSDGETIQPNSLPLASFSIDPLSAQVGVDIVLDASASSDADGVISDYMWQFGDGSSGQGNPVVHSYTRAGDQTITLTVTDNSGGTAQLSKTLSVQSGFSLSGAIEVAGNIVTDSDVNDPAAPYSINDTAQMAQLLPNPAIVNGFSSASGSARPGDRFATSGDTADVYRISLLAGQLITLQLVEYDDANPQAHDVDLFLLNSEQKLVAASDSYAEFESIVAPFTGAAYIRVESDSGINKYVLRVGNDFTAGRVASGNTSVDFIPSQVLIGYRADAGIAAMGVDTRQLLAAHQVASSAPVAPLQLMTLGSSERCQQLIEQLRNSYGGYDQLSKTVHQALTAMAMPDPGIESDEKYITLKLLKSLRKRGDVAFAEPNYIIRPSSEPNDYFYPLQWHLPYISLPAAWDISSAVPAADKVVVAVVDSGVLLNHPDLDGQLVAGYDFISDQQVAADGDGIDANPNDVGDKEEPGGRSSFHGTHVAGTVAALSDNGRGVASVAGAASSIMPIRVLGVGGGSEYDLIQGIRYAAGLSNDSLQLPARRADIINLSLGCASCFSQSMQDTINEARAAGVILVAAAGNNSNSLPFFPAAYDGVVAVSAVNSASELAGYSSFGSYIDVAAPGGDEADRNGDSEPDQVFSTLGDDSSGSVEYLYGRSSGTSMASPHVAGVAALMKAAYPALTPNDFDLALASGAAVQDLGALGRDDFFGHGVIDALKAVQTAQSLGGGQPVGVVTANPTVLDFTQGVSIKTFELSAIGSNPPQIRSVSADQPWLSVEPGNDVGPDLLGVHIVQVDPEGLASAVYQARITVALSNNTELLIPVYMQVLDAQHGSGSPGLLYVLLRNSDSLTASHQTEISIASDGSFRYQFDSSVPAGNYRVFAGSDVDNDKIICGAGETCGAWPTRDRAEDIVVDRDLTGLDFELITDGDFGIEQEGRVTPDVRTLSPMERR